jgi:hypothetical protein
MVTQESAEAAEEKQLAIVNELIDMESQWLKGLEKGNGRFSRTAARLEKLKKLAELI